MKSKDKFETREMWLLNAVEAMKPLFKQYGYEVPKVRVSCGWPSSRGKSSKNASLGEAWDKSAASDSVAQLFISPILKNPVAAQGVLPTLAHEVCHAVVGNKEKHNKVFGACARAIGLEGKLTATHGGEAFFIEAKKWMNLLGEYPHAELNPGGRPTKKQTTRMVKCECKDCGYVARTSRKWLDASGAPICPCNSESMLFELSEGENETDE
jgi:hypothetical protein